MKVNPDVGWRTFVPHWLTLTLTSFVVMGLIAPNLGWSSFLCRSALPPVKRTARWTQLRGWPLCYCGQDINLLATSRRRGVPLPAAGNYWSTRRLQFDIATAILLVVCTVYSTERILRRARFQPKASIRGLLAMTAALGAFVVASRSGNYAVLGGINQLHNSLGQFSIFVFIAIAFAFYAAVDLAGWLYHAIATRRVPRSDRRLPPFLRG